MKRPPRPAGGGGGRTTIRPFFFAPDDHGKYPSESPTIRQTRLTDANQRPSWVWALSHAELNDLWLVVPLDGKADLKREINSIRSTLFRSAHRRGQEITTEVYDDTLYARVL